eukprot:2947153-Pyramimonas_sp.AAC.1
MLLLLELAVVCWQRPNVVGLALECEFPQLLGGKSTRRLHARRWRSKQFLLKLIEVIVDVLMLVVVIEVIVDDLR